MQGVETAEHMMKMDSERLRLNASEEKQSKRLSLEADLSQGEGQPRNDIKQE